MIHRSCLAVATWCFALSCLVLACLTKQKPFTYMLLNISNTSCNWLAQFSGWILYICTMWCGYSYLLKKWYLDIYKNIDETKQGRARQSMSMEHSTQTWRFPLVLTNCTNIAFPLSNNFMFIITTQIAKFMEPTWSPTGSCWPQMGPMLAPWTLLSGYV